VVVAEAGSPLPLRRRPGQPGRACPCYSGADLVSAGDTVLVDRSLVRRAGTDPARLREAVRAAGGTDYRTHR
jgi:hypothetical protein